MRPKQSIDHQTAYPHLQTKRYPKAWPWIPLMINGKYFIVGDEWCEVSKKEHDEFLFNYKAGLTPLGTITQKIIASIHKKKKEPREWKVQSDSDPNNEYTVYVDNNNILKCTCWGYRWGYCKHARKKRNELHLPYLMKKEHDNKIKIDDIVYDK